MSARFSLFAEVIVDPELITVGNVIAGLMVMAMLVGSLVMIVSWGIRLSRGQEMMPTAGRQPLFVPLPLMIFGIALTAMMAGLMLKNTSIPPQRGVAPAAAIVAMLMNDPDLPTEERAPVIDMVDFGGADDEATIDENPAADRAAADATGADATGASPDAESQPLSMVYQQLMFFATIFMMFGASIWLTQLNHSRSVMGVENLPYATSAATESISHAGIRLTDLDDPPEITAEHPTLLDADASPVLSGAKPQGESATVAEKWHVATELRCACEALLAAYLPTATLKILIEKALPESPSHPFLEMLNDGVSWTLLLLIGFMAVVVAPIVEELLYRVTILGGIMQRRSLVTGWILSSVLFAFAHGFPDSLALLPLAFAIGYTYIKRRSYRTVVLVHFLFNTFNMTVAGLALL